MNDVEEFKAYLTEMLGRADNTVSTANMRAQMWGRFLPAALEFWGMAGVLERIADHVRDVDAGGVIVDDDEDC